MHHKNDKTIKCCCGSGLPTRDVYVRGIFVARVCDKYAEKKRAGHYSSSVNSRD